MTNKKSIGKMRPQELMDWLSSRLNGWTVALISKGPQGFRLQLQSEPPESMDCGMIRCVTAPTIEGAVEEAIEFAKGNPQTHNATLNPKP